MRKIITLALLVLATAANAQTTGNVSGQLNVFSTLGLSFVDSDYKPATGNSVQTTTGMELRLSRPSSIGLALSFDSYGYERSGASYQLDGSLKSTALALFYRHKFGTGSWQPYLKAGGGTAWLSFPTIEQVRTVTNIQKKVQNVGVAMAEVGLQVRILPRYSMLVGVEKKWMGKASHLDNTSLRTTGFKVGLISSF